MLKTALIIILGIIFLALLPAFAQDAPQPTAALTPTPRPTDLPRFLFDNDTCAPPCWFGLIPGESTAAEADAFFHTHPEMFSQEYPPKPIGTFDTQTGYLIDGVYLFHNLPDYHYYPDDPDRLYIRDGKVFRLSMRRYPSPSLGEVIDRLGMPDQVHIRHHERSGDEFDLIYLKWRLRVSTWAEPCHSETVLQDTYATEVRYYSPQAASEINSYISYYDVEQPALTALEYQEISVPLEDWEEWLDSSSCSFRSVAPNPPNIHFDPLVVTEPETPHSIFIEDTCAPPCWFGLTPGQSTSADVVALLKSQGTRWQWWLDEHAPNTFDPKTGNMVDGWYKLGWGENPFGEHGTNIGGGRFTIYINGGKVKTISIYMNRVVFLQDVLKALGTPDVIIQRGGEYIDPRYFPTSLYFIYSDLHLGIGLSSQDDWCRYSLGQDFWVESVSYITGDSDEEPNVAEGIVSPDEWASWLQKNCYIDIDP